MHPVRQGKYTAATGVSCMSGRLSERGLVKCRAGNSRAASIEGFSMQSMGCWHTGWRNALGAAVQTFQFYLRFYNKDTKCPTLCQIILSSGMNGE